MAGFKLVTDLFRRNNHNQTQQQLMDPVKEHCLVPAQALEHKKGLFPWISGLS